MLAAIDEELKLVNGVDCLYERSDAMLSIYPSGGARFARHIDNTTNDGRKATVLIYLNPLWTQGMGGELRIANESADPAKLSAIDISPVASRLLVFRSATLAHEVMPTTTRDRHAMTMWYYNKEERREALRRSAESGKGNVVANSSTIEDQTAAKQFIGELMGGDEIGEDGGQPTKEDLQVLCAKVRQMPSSSLGIVTSITGAPSEASFREGFELLVPEDLKSMRQLFDGWVSTNDNNVFF